MPMLSYVPGSVESLWKNVSGDNCHLLHSAALGQDLKFALKYTTSAMHTSQRTPASMQQRNALSSLEVDRDCTELLEPLTGAARHPQADHLGCFLQSMRPAIHVVNKYNSIICCQ